MATYKITGPDGRTVKLNAPDGATEEQINAKINEIKSSWSAAPAAPEPAPKPDVSRLESGLRGGAQGATFGFGDELVGGLAAAGGLFFGDTDLAGNYAKARDTIREGDRRAQEANPGTYLAGELVGGVALPFGVAKAATKLPQAGQTIARVTGLAPEIGRGASFTRRVSEGARTGAAYGGLYGAGMSEADTVGGLAKDTAQGIGAGALVGGIAAPVVDTVAAVGRGVMAPIRALKDPKGFAAEKVVEGLSRDLKSGPRLEARARVAAKADADTMLADLGGTSTKRLVRAAQNQQSPRNETFKLKLDQRAKFQANKIERGLREGLRLGADDFYQSVDDVSARMKDIGEQGFRPALSVETPMTPELAAVFERPTTKRLMEHVKARLADEGKPIGFETRTEALHRVKIELNSLIREAEKAQKLGNATGWDVNSLRTIKRDMMNAWDNKAYKDASRLYADEASLKTAAERGEDEFMKLDWQEVRSAMKDMSKAEQAMYRRGALQSAMRSIREGNPMGDKVAKVGGDNMQNRLRQLFPDGKEWREFQRLLVTVSRQNKTRAAAQGNSTTAQQMSDMVDSQNMTEAAKTVANAATGNWRGLLDAAGRYGNRAMGMTPDVADEVLRILSQRPATVNLGRGGTTAEPYAVGRRARQALNTPEMIEAERRLAKGADRRGAVSRGLTTGIVSPLVGGFGPKWER